MAAITAKVARMVGLPTSSTASTAISESRRPRFWRQAEMSYDVLHHDNRVVDQDADGEDQREQRDAVQGVAEEVEDEQGERQRYRNGDQHHARFAPAERERDQQRDRKRRQQQVLQQFVGLVLGGLAVVARDGDIQVLRQQVAAQLLDFLQRLFADDGRVRAFALGQRDGHRRKVAVRSGFRAPGSIGVENVIAAARPVHRRSRQPRRADKPACPDGRRPRPASDRRRCPGSVRPRPGTPDCPGRSCRQCCVRWPAATAHVTAPAVMP